MRACAIMLKHKTADIVHMHVHTILYTHIHDVKLRAYLIVTISQYLPTNVYPFTGITPHSQMIETIN